MFLFYIGIHVCLKYITTPNQGCKRHTLQKWRQKEGKFQWGNVVAVYVFDKTEWKCPR